MKPTTKLTTSEQALLSELIRYEWRTMSARAIAKKLAIVYETLSVTKQEKVNDILHKLDMPTKKLVTRKPEKDERLVQVITALSKRERGILYKMASVGFAAKADEVFAVCGSDFTRPQVERILDILLVLDVLRWNRGRYEFATRKLYNFLLAH